MPDQRNDSEFTHQPLLLPQPVDSTGTDHIVGELLGSLEDEHLTYVELSSYIDGRLSGAGRKDIDDHIATCPMCSADLSHLFVVAAEIGGFRLHRTYFSQAYSGQSDERLHDVFVVEGRHTFSANCGTAERMVLRTTMG
jgi:hypothetical protein